MGCWHWDLNSGQRLMGCAFGSMQRKLSEEVCRGARPCGPRVAGPPRRCRQDGGTCGFGLGRAAGVTARGGLHGLGGDTLDQHGRGWSMTCRQGAWAVMGMGVRSSLGGRGPGLSGLSGRLDLPENWSWNNHLREKRNQGCQPGGPRQSERWKAVSSGQCLLVSRGASGQVTLGWPRGGRWWSP